MASSASLSSLLLVVIFATQTSSHFLNIRWDYRRNPYCPRPSFFSALRARISSPYPFINVCEGKGSLGDRQRVNLGFHDVDNNGNISFTELHNEMANNFDRNGDGCVSVQETIARLSDLGFSCDYAVQRARELLPAGVPFNPSCVLRVSDLSSVVTSMTPEEFIYQNMRAVINGCRTNPVLFSTNCDCAQLVWTCSYDHFVRDNRICIDFINEVKGNN